MEVARGRGEPSAAGVLFFRREAEEVKEVDGAEEIEDAWKQKNKETGKQGG